MNVSTTFAEGGRVSFLRVVSKSASPLSRRVLISLRAFCAIVFVAAAQAAEPPAPPAPPTPGVPSAPDEAGIHFFETKIRPLLAGECYSCHSVSAKKLKAKLFTDSLAGILKGGESGPALVPGQPEKSKIIEAVGYKNQDLQMPPDSKLTDAQVADLTQWVKLGAPWPKESPPQPSAAGTAMVETFDLQKRKASHWAWKPLSVQTSPAVKNAAWITDPLDAFVLKKLDDKNLVPAAPADKRTLLRRATFDLIGLPPKPEDVDTFVKDESPQAFEKVVDRLLASPQYGERWARHWLDLTRYAESYGHEFDFSIPNVYRYRDYVIRALNADVPYNQFAIEHIAGDLMEKPRVNPADGLNESVAGTAFYFLGENVHSPVDIRQHQADRFDNEIEVTCKTFLGMTLNCARCHDHKFDALSAADYYAMYGYLKSSRYRQAVLNQSVIQTKADELAQLKKQLFALALPELKKKASEGLGAALEKFKPAGKLEPTHPLYPLFRVQSTPPVQLAEKWKGLGAEFDKKAKELNVPSTKGPPDLDLAISFDEAAFQKGPGFVPGTEARRPIAELREAGWIGSDSLSRKLQGTARTKSFKIEGPSIHVLAKGQNAIARVVIDNFIIIRSPIYGGLTKHLKSDKEQWLTFDVHMWQGHEAYLEFSDSTVAFPGEESGALDPNGHIAVRDINFSGAHGRSPSESSDALAWMAAYIANHEAPATLNDLVDSFSKDVLAALTRVEAKLESVSSSDASLLNALLESGLLDLKPSPELEVLVKKYREVEASIPAPIRVPAITDGNGVDECVFIRGNPKLPGPVVPRRFLEALSEPSALAPNKSSEGSGRMELAQRIVDPANPLFSRVMVNRIWHHLFGRGIVASTDNFGKLGEEPTHLELLDFLAQRFIQDGYSIKKTIRRTVLSSAYRMASMANPANDAKADPDNKLLAHQRIKRLEGEAIRDTMLTVSGRLDATMFGPSVDVHLTPFMTGRGRPGSGPLDGAGRRSLYTSVRRNFLSPMMLAFDTPSPFSTMGRRTISNVPAQALILMNDPFVIGQAELWAKRILADKSTDPAQRVTAMYRAAFARDPMESETKSALEFIDEQLKESGATELTAWKDYAHVLMNAKEFVFVK